MSDSKQSVPLCRHYACRCARAAELASIAGMTGNARYLAEAVAVHDQEVRCRKDDLIEEMRRA